MAPHLSYLQDKEKRQRRSVPSVKSVGQKNKQREKKICGKTKKASEIFRNLRLLIKEGGYLLSRIALQYHRRK